MELLRLNLSHKCITPPGRPALSHQQQAATAGDSRFSRNTTLARKLFVDELPRREASIARGCLGLRVARKAAMQLSRNSLGRWSTVSQDFSYAVVQY